MNTLAVIIFSRDRAMQLHANLSSLKKYAQHYKQAHIYVLYKTEKYQYQYDQLVKEFNEVSFVRETNLTEQSHKILLKYNAIMYVVDDTIFYRNFNIVTCLDCLFSHNEALGFSLRIGRNITRSHISNTDIEQPKFQKLDDNYFRFAWPKKQRDFGYPLEVSSSIYRTSDIIPLLKKVHGDPGSIESYLNQQKNQFRESKPFLLCHDKSVAFACPVNIIRDTTRCPHGRKYSYSIEKLAALFDEGNRIDISVISELINACHVEMEYKFTK